MNTEQRFRAKVAPANANGCQLWAACTNGYGYGGLWDGGRQVLAHRYAWELANGPIPEGLCVLHSCDTPACVNTDHLFLGTIADNNADMHAKGRARRGDQRGSKNGNAKLNEALAVEVFRDTGTQQAIAARHGISNQCVSRIKLRQHWAHATAGMAA